MLQPGSAQHRFVEPHNLAKPAQAQEQKRQRHLPELDALRGLAAFIVLLNHFYAAWSRAAHPSWLNHPMHNPLLWFLIDGHASVILFFLLSGFVLTLPRLHGSRPTYSVFALRRVCRICLPYLAALTFSAVACGLFLHLRLDGHLLFEIWRQPPDARSLLEHVVMLGRLDMCRYDGPVWSLVHEMRVSLIFPLVLFLALRMGAVTTLLTAAGCSVVASISLALFESNLPDGVAMLAWSYTGSVCGVFLLGAGLARRYDVLTRKLDRLHLCLRAGLLIVAMALYLYPPPAWHRIHMGDFCIACAGLVLLTFALRQQGIVVQLLRLRPIQFLGTISYSLYLLHFPILMFVSAMASPKYAFGWLLLPFLAVSILAAAAMYRLVELPSMALGRQVRDMHFPSLSSFAVEPQRNPQM